MLLTQPGAVLQLAQQGPERKQLKQRLLLELLPGGLQRLGSGLVFFNVARKSLDGSVADDAGRRKRIAEHEPFQRAAAAQGHVHLAVGKSGIGVNDGFVKGEALAFVNGDGPGQLQRILTENAGYRFLNFFCSFVQYVFKIAPFGRLHVNGLLLAGTLHDNHVFPDLVYGTDFPVEIPLFAGDVVFGKHDLRAFFKGQGLLRRVHVVGKISLNDGREGLFPARKFLQFPLVDLLGLVIMRGEGDVALAGRRTEAGQAAAVELLQKFTGQLVVADGVEDVDKGLVPLAVDVLQGHAHILGFLQGLAAEEKRGLVMILQQLPLFVLHHGGQLLQVADHEQLHASECPVAVFVPAQHFVNGIEHVGAYHTDLVNHQQIQTADDADFFAAEPAGRFPA